MKNSNNRAALDHLNLTVHNFDETVSWYSKIFGFELVEEEVSDESGRWGVLRNGKSMLCIYEDSKRTFPESNHLVWEKHHQIYHFGLSIKNKHAWEEKLKREKIEIIYGPIGYPHSTSWYIKDPTGYKIEVVHWDQNEVSFQGAQSK